MRKSFETVKKTYEDAKESIKEKWEQFKEKMESFKNEMSKEMMSAESPDEIIEIGKKIQEEGELLKKEQEEIFQESEQEEEEGGAEERAETGGDSENNETEEDLDEKRKALEEEAQASKDADLKEAERLSAEVRGEEVEDSEGEPQEENVEGQKEEEKMDSFQLMEEIRRLQRHVDEGVTESRFVDALEERKREYNEMMEKLRGENKEEISEEAREIQRHYLEKENLYTDLRKENGNDWDDPELNRRLLLNVADEGDPERLKVMMENFGYDKEAFKNNIINETNKGLGPKSSENWFEIMKLAGMSEDEIHENAASKLTKDSHIHLKEPGNASYMVESIIKARDAYGISDEEWARIAHDIYFKDPEKMGRALEENDSVASLFVDRGVGGGWVWKEEVLEKRKKITERKKAEEAAAEKKKEIISSGQKKIHEMNKSNQNKNSSYKELWELLINEKKQWKNPEEIDDKRVEDLLNKIDQEELS